MHRPDWSRIAIHALELVVIVVFGFLIRDNAVLRRQVRAAAASSAARAFVPGDSLKTVPALDVGGGPVTIDFMRSRSIVAIVDPRCASCETLVASLPGTPDLRVLSVAQVAETRTMAAKLGIAGNTSSVPFADTIARQLRIYPQLIVVDHGKVVRTCATIAECRSASAL